VERKKPLVSILCVTYNQIKYLPEAIDSFISQKVNFEIEICIIDDCSTDGTSDLCISYCNKYPLISYHRNPKNFGVIDSYIIGLKKCKGEFIAYCDGDDFWTDVMKLQKQVDYMLSNPDVMMTHHNDTLIYERTIDYKVYGPIIKNPTILDLYNNHFISSPSIFCRNIFTNKHYELMRHAGSGDIAIFLLCRLYGRIEHINQNMACYRLSFGAQTSIYYENIKRQVANYKYICLLNNRYKLQLNRELRDNLYSLFPTISNGLSQLSLILRTRIKLNFIISLWSYIPLSVFEKFLLSYNFIRK
jgi:glycosyltransferase involved in cell wall biosynthesis